MFEDKRVTIRADLAEVYDAQVVNNPGAHSLNKIVNIVFEKYLEGRFVELNDFNLQKIKEVAAHYVCTNNDAINIALNQVEFDLRETPKTRITLDRGDKVKIKKSKTKGANPVTDYK